MSRLLGIAGIQMKVVHGQDNTAMMLKKMNAVNTLFPWVEIIFFSELCLSGLDMKLSLDRFTKKKKIKFSIRP